MVGVTVRTGNCDPKSCFKVEEIAESQVELRLEFERVVTSQSKKRFRDELCSEIQKELQKFEWICSGPLNVEFCWYLHGTNRQETDKIGDIDNITKPVLDSLTGPNGILVDDSQVKSLHTFWLSRNHESEKDALLIRVDFSNDLCLRKENLLFIQYTGAVCLPLNVDFARPLDLFAALMITKSRLKSRAASKQIRQLGANVDRMLVDSFWDIHRTRLGAFDKSAIFTLSDFKMQCLKSGFSWVDLLRLRRKGKIANKK